MNRQTVEGWTPLHLAARRCCTEVVEELLAAGADASLLDAEGRSALHSVARAADVELFGMLFARAGGMAAVRDAKGASNVMILK